MDTIRMKHNERNNGLQMCLLIFINGDKSKIFKINRRFEIIHTKEPFYTIYILFSSINLHNRMNRYID